MEMVNCWVAYVQGRDFLQWLSSY